MNTALLKPNVGAAKIFGLSLEFSNSNFSSHTLILCIFVIGNLIVVVSIKPNLSSRKVRVLSYPLIIYYTKCKEILIQFCPKTKKQNTWKTLNKEISFQNFVFSF